MEPISAISAIVSAITIVEKIYSSGKWVSSKYSEWKPSVTLSTFNEKIKIEGAEYYKLTPDNSIWRTFSYGKEEFREEKRLTHVRLKLLDMYPGLAGRLLVDNRVGQMPYQVLNYEISDLIFSICDTDFKIPVHLRGIYDATHNGLKKHYQQIGIQYQPLILARVCDIVSEPFESITIGKANYSDAASTNLIADLNIRSVLGKTLLLEDSNATATSIRGYDLSLSETPGCIPSFQKSCLANPIGVAGIILTADNKLVLAHRSRSVSTYAGKLGPSSSGYVSWADVLSSKNGSFDSILRFSLKREISEELHLDIACDISEMCPLGLFRELYRAGMPQVFYGVKINLTSEELIARIIDSRTFPELMGILFIPVNRQVLMNVITMLVRTSKVKSWPIGLEVQGLLTALARKGEKFFFG